MSENETPETPHTPGPADDVVAPDATSETASPAEAPAPPAPAPAAPAPPAAPTPPPPAAAPDVTRPAPPPAPPAPAPGMAGPIPDAAGHVPGTHHLPTAESQPAPFTPDPALAPGVVPAPAHGEFGPNKKLPLGAIIGIIAGGVVVLLVLAAAIIVPLLGRSGGDASGGGAGDEPAPAASTPEEWVEAYLTAVSEGDAEEAAKYLDTSSYSDELLTDEVLAASLELGAIEDIEVGEAEEGEYSDVTVTATFTIGGTEVSRDFEMYQSEYDGEITMLDGAARVSTYSFDDVGLTVNGVEVPDDALVFPGIYEFGTVLEEFAIEGESTLIVADDKSEEAVTMLRPVLSEAGVASYRELVTTSLRECLALKSLNTPCGMDVTGLEKDGYAVVDGTVTRTLTAEGEAALAGLTGEVTDRAVVSKYDTLTVDITFEGQNAAGQRGGFEVLWGSQMLTPKVDFAADDPKVVWE